MTASYGTSGFTDDHLALFKQVGVERIVIAYGRDESGNTASEKLSKQLQKAGFDCHRIELPKNRDVNEYALQVTPANKRLGLVICKAVWMGKGRVPKRESTGSAIDESENDSQSIPSLVAELLEPAILPPAAALPEAPANDIEAVVSEKEIQLMFGARKYRIRGLEKNKNYELLKVNVLVSCDDPLHVDTFNLYAAQHRQAFIKVASLELGIEETILKKDLGKVLLKLEERQEQLINGQPQADQPSSISDHEKESALELLRDPDLLDRVLSDFIGCGLVGEEVNKRVCYLAAGSRKLD